MARYQHVISLNSQQEDILRQARSTGAKIVDIVMLGCRIVSTEKSDEKNISRRKNSDARREN